jgi:hypothetical protein
VIDSACQAVRRALEDGNGVDGGARLHLDGCPSCRAHAAVLVTLDRLRVGEADSETVQRVMAALPPAPWRHRRPAAWLPVAAGLALFGVGLGLLGGVPAPGAVSALPGALSGLAGWLASSLLDAVAAARGGAEAVHALLAVEGLSLVLWLIMTAAGSGLAVRALVRRRAGVRR